MRRVRYCVALTLMVSIIAGCVVNPVTGERNLGLVSQTQEIAIGVQQYGPSQQMQGGEFTTDPGLTAYVSGVGRRLAAVSAAQLPYEFVVLNNSIPNAWALPGGKIAVNRGLLIELNNEAELAAVLGHEITHAAARHGAQAMERGLLMQVVLAAAVIGAADSNYAGAVVGAAQLGATLITQKYGRDAEREADAYGIRTMTDAGYDPSAAVTLQETFVRLSEGKRQDWLSGLFASHPPSQERVENNKVLLAQLPKGGEVGAAPFQAAIAPLKADRDLYRSADAARKALAAGDVAAASAKAEHALAGESREASFHALRGDIRLREKRYADAIADYDNALALDDGYFAYYLGRGLARIESGVRAGAKEDLDRSITLLPTAPAYQGLGRLAEAAGNVDAALRYYQAAAQSDSTSGRAARDRYLEIDVPRRPAQYVETRIVMVEGRPVLQVRNAGVADLRDIGLRVRLTWSDGKVNDLNRRVDQLPVGRQVVLSLPTRAATLTNAQAVAVAAAVAR
jgi:beta-barrel assembly-enhancing protease